MDNVTIRNALYASIKEVMESSVLEMKVRMQSLLEQLVVLRNSSLPKKF